MIVLSKIQSQKSSESTPNGASPKTSFKGIHFDGSESRMHGEVAKSNPGFCFTSEWCSEFGQFSVSSEKGVVNSYFRFGCPKLQGIWGFF